MKKKPRLQDRIKEERDSSEKFDQGFKMEPMKVASLATAGKQGLSIEQTDKIQALFSEYKTVEVSSERFNEDLQKTLEISSSIKNIVEQSALLIGERIQKAQSVMSNYRGGMFNKWLLLVFGNKVTPYNILNYYTLHLSIEDSDIRTLLEKLPKRAAYKLASRKGALEEKIQVLNDCSSMGQEGKFNKIKASHLEKLIEQKFPISSSDNRSFGNKVALGDIRAKITSCLYRLIKLDKGVGQMLFTDQEKELMDEAVFLLKKWNSNN